MANSDDKHHIGGVSTQHHQEQMQNSSILLATWKDYRVLILLLTVGNNSLTLSVLQSPSNGPINGLGPENGLFDMP